ncbi:MAG: sulfur reduction protein DsrE [Chloroflexi bacterium HGW-Chloroflexi-1]|nr:MAG: sulfur reduction protein DsrE [Chloroflexi bacterium HGW-Chloroflexi-1]
MADDTVLIIMTSGPDTPRRCATPFFFASLAAAMEYEVNMFFTIDGTLLLKKGLAETVYPKAGGKPVSAFIQDALDAGVNFMACTASTELHDLAPEDLIEGVKMVGGATMWLLAEDSKTVLTF